MTLLGALALSAPACSEPARPRGPAKPAEQGPTLPQLIDRNVAARGGYEVLARITSLTFEGERVSSEGGGRHKAGFVKMRPHYFLVGCTAPSCPYAEGYDGSAWEMSPKAGRVVRVRGEAARALARMARFDDPFIGYREKGHSARLAGVETFFGRPAYRVDMTMSDGLREAYYIDAETFLLAGNRRSVPVHARGEHLDTVTRFEAHRPVLGVLYPFTVVSYDAKSGRETERLEWQTVRPNVPYDASFFSPPPVDPPPTTRLVLAMLEQSERLDAASLLRLYRDFRARPENARADAEGDLTWLGYELLKQGDEAKAVAVLSLVVDEHPRSANAHDSLGDAYLQKGDRALAAASFRKALALDPSAEGTRRKLEALEPPPASPPRR